jgi:hypothetical protein
MKLRVRFDGSNLVPLDPVDLPAGQILDIEVHGVAEPVLGSAQSILDAIWSHPELDSETCDEFERILQEARVPAPNGGVFDDLSDES